MTDWMDRPLADMAQALHDGNVNEVKIAETAIARHDAWDDKLTAYEMWNAENALDQPGPLPDHGGSDRRI